MFVSVQRECPFTMLFWEHGCLLVDSAYRYALTQTLRTHSHTTFLLPDPEQKRETHVHTSSLCSKKCASNRSAGWLVRHWHEAFEHCKRRWTQTDFHLAPSRLHHSIPRPHRFLGEETSHVWEARIVPALQTGSKVRCSHHGWMDIEGYWELQSHDVPFHRQQLGTSLLRVGD